MQNKTTMRCHFTLNELAYMKIRQFHRLVKMWNNEHSHTWLVGIHFAAITLKANVVSPNLIKHMRILWPNNSTASYLACVL